METKGIKSINSEEIQEKAFHSAAPFYRDLLYSIENSKKFIDINVYIFENDDIGNKIFQALSKASQRGVKCRLLVDGFGSKDWIGSFEKSQFNKNLEVRVFHPLPFFGWFNIFSILRHFYSLFSRINRRDHKKLFIVDRKWVYISSINITDKSYGQREAGIKINYAFEECQFYFDLTWKKSNKFTKLQKFNFKITKPYSKLIKSKFIRNNFNRATRKYYNDLFFESIKSAQNRVWIVTPYFVPTGRFLRALNTAAKKGVDVKLLLPANPDIPIMKHVAHYYYPKLFKIGVEVFEFRNQFLHAKVSFIDDQIMVGSSNYDSRSFFTNLEIDLFLQNQSTKESFTEHFHKDLSESQEMFTSPTSSGFWNSVLARLVIYMETLT